jgi:hypothetical protein
MAHPLENDDYNNMLVTDIANQSDLFSSYVQSAVTQIDSELPTEEIWLGTLYTGEEKAHTQIKIVVTRDPQHFVDEN